MCWTASPGGRFVPNVAENPQVAIDPVCGMTVSLATAKHRFDHAGQTYYFCCAGCRTKFAAEPAKFLDRPRRSGGAGLVMLGMPKAASPASATSAPGTQVGPAGLSAPTKTAAQPGERYYVCPMCPEVRQVAPGPCPSCGMALEPETALPASRIEYTCPMHPEV